MSTMAKEWKEPPEVLPGSAKESAGREKEKKKDSKQKKPTPR